MIARLLVTVSSLGSNPEKQCHEIFRFMFFSLIIYPQTPENNIRVILNFCRKFAEIQGAPLVSTTKAANNGNYIRLVTPYGELEGKNSSMC